MNKHTNMTILDQGVSEIEYEWHGRAYFIAEGWESDEWYIDEFLKYDDGKAVLPLTNSSAMQIQVNDESDEVTWKYVTN